MQVSRLVYVAVRHAETRGLHRGYDVAPVSVTVSPGITVTTRGPGAAALDSDV